MDEGNLQAKNKFFNPICQKRQHAKYVKELLGDVVVKEIVVFSERCELKKIDVVREGVIKCNDLKKVMMENRKEKVYNPAQINNFCYH